MRKIYDINDNWEFTPVFGGEFLNGENAEDVTVEQVRLPHTCKVTPFHYFDESIYQMVCGYRRRLDLSDRGDRRAFICFGAAAHYAKVYLDGELIGEHKSGYTAFEFELVTDNPTPLLAVELDTRESLNFPPFGKVIDYLTYGGLYRESRLEFREQSFLDDVFAKPSVPDAIRVSSKANPRLVAGLSFDGVIDCDPDIIGDADEVHMSVTQKDDDTVLSEVTVPVGGSEEQGGVPEAALWDGL